MPDQHSSSTEYRQAIVGPFIPAYHALLDMPAYVQVVDTSKVGALLRQLRRMIWRGAATGTDHLLSAMHAGGMLACSARDTSLAEQLGVTPRYVRKLRASLQQLGLIVTCARLDYHEDQYVYVLGHWSFNGKRRVEHYTEDRWAIQAQSAAGQQQLTMHLTSPAAPVPQSDVLDVFRVPDVVSAFQNRFFERSGTPVPHSRNTSSGCGTGFHGEQDAENPPLHTEGKEKSLIEEKEQALRARSRPVSKEAKMVGDQPGLFGEDVPGRSDREIGTELSRLLDGGNVRGFLDALDAEDVEARHYLMSLKARTQGVNYANESPLAAWVHAMCLGQASAYKAPEWLYLWWRAYEIDHRHVTRENPAKVRSLARFVTSLTDERADLALRVISLEYKANRRLGYQTFGWVKQSVSRFLNANPDFIASESARERVAAALRERPETETPDPLMISGGTWGARPAPVVPTTAPAAPSAPETEEGFDPGDALMLSFQRRR